MSGTPYLWSDSGGGGGSSTVIGGSGFAMSPLAPTTDTAITPGYGTVLPDYFEITAGNTLDIGLGGVLDIT